MDAKITESSSHRTRCVSSFAVSVERAGPRVVGNSVFAAPREGAWELPENESSFWACAPHAELATAVLAVRFDNVSDTAHEAKHYVL